MRRRSRTCTMRSPALAGFPAQGDSGPVRRGGPNATDTPAHAQGGRSVNAGAPLMPWACAIARRLVMDSAPRRPLERRLFSETPSDDDRMTNDPTAVTAAPADILHTAS